MAAQWATTDFEDLTPGEYDVIALKAPPGSMAFLGSMAGQKIRVVERDKTWSPFFGERAVWCPGPVGVVINGQISGFTWAIGATEPMVEDEAPRFQFDVIGVSQIQKIGMVSPLPAPLPIFSNFGPFISQQLADSLGMRYGLGTLFIKSGAIIGQVQLQSGY